MICLISIVLSSNHIPTYKKTVFLSYCDRRQIDSSPSTRVIVIQIEDIFGEHTLSVIAISASGSVAMVFVEPYINRLVNCG